jgi:hypothetical protein
MSQSLSSSLFNQRVKGMYGGPRATKGNDGSGDIGRVSGTTYGGSGYGWFWQSYPNVISGLTEYDPQATITGSNMGAVGATEAASESKVGGGPSQAQVPDYGGTAAY